MGTRLGRYDIIRPLAKGELTDLLLGRAGGMEGFERHVAIKRLRAEHAADAACLEMFVNEARLAAALHHHNIVQVLDIGEGDGQPFFAMEYVHGVDLRKLLGHLAKRGEQLPIPHVVSIIASAAAALHHAHDRRAPDGKPLGIVHRQVAPGNILVGFDGNVKIVDFGIAKAAIKRIQTRVGVLRGLAPYMAPEQCAGRPVDRRSDVFALGIVLYELSTVRRLFKGANEFLTMSAVVNAEVPRPSQYRRDVPAELETVMLKALAREPADRYQSAGDMANALDQVARMVGVGASTTQLASYMKLQFGDQKEPWLVEVEHDPETTEVDFDGAASGLAPPPSESVKNLAIPKQIAPTKSAPIVRARTSVATPAGTRNARPATPSVDRSFDVATAVDPAPDPNDEAITNVDDESPGDDPIAPQPTAVANPPPPPRAPSGPGGPRPGMTDATAIVEPLSVLAARVQTIEAARRSRAPLWIGIGAVAVIGVIIGAIAMWPSAELGPMPSAAAPAPAPSAEPPAAPTSDPAPSALEMTARDYENARAVADAGVAVAAERPPPIETPPPDAAIAEAPVEPVSAPPVEAPLPSETKQAAVETTAKPAKRAETKPAVRPAPATTKRTAPKPVSKRKPAKKPAPKRPKPKWNPDDLFLGE